MSIALWAMSLIANPWAAETVYYSSCEPAPVYIPYTPPAVTIPPTQSVAAQEVTDVAAEKAEAVTENIAATDPILEPVGLTLPSMNLGHLALDWGVASIASGTLLPTPGIQIGTGLGGFPFFGRGGLGTNNGSSPIIYNLIVNNVGATGGTTVAPVPEPGSLAVWMVAGVGALWHWRRRSRT